MGSESEVNVFVDDAGRVEAAFSRHLLGLVFLRTTGAAWQHVPLLRRLRDRLRTLGHVAPIFALTTEDRSRLDLWRHDRSIDLRAHPYSLEVLE